VTHRSGIQKVVEKGSKLFFLNFYNNFPRNFSWIDRLENKKEIKGRREKITELKHNTRHNNRITGRGVGFSHGL
jgi:hypothetical protein